jgi:predicted aconitase with swiveling domain
MKGGAIRGRGLVDGWAEGAPLVSARAFTFAHGVDPATGQVTDVRSDIRGANVGGKILCYPYGKGSTTASAWFIEAVRCGNAPAALVTEGVDLSAVIGSVLAGLVYGKTIPVLSGVPMGLLSQLPPGAFLTVDGKAGQVVVKD